MIKAYHLNHLASMAPRAHLEPRPFATSIQSSQQFARFYSVSAHSSALPSSSTGRSHRSVPCVRKRLAGSLVQSYMISIIKRTPNGVLFIMEEPNGLDSTS